MLSLLAHRDKVGLADGQLLVDGTWRAYTELKTVLMPLTDELM